MPTRPLTLLEKQWIEVAAIHLKLNGPAPMSPALSKESYHSLKWLKTRSSPFYS